MSGSFVGAPAVLLVVALLPLCRPGAQGLSARDRAQLVAMLWSDARANVAGWARVRADWDSALAASLRAAALTRQDLVCYSRLRRLVAQLVDGHTQNAPASA